MVEEVVVLLCEWICLDLILNLYRTYLENTQLHVEHKVDTRYHSSKNIENI